MGKCENFWEVLERMGECGEKLEILGNYLVVWGNIWEFRGEWRNMLEH